MHGAAPVFLLPVLLIALVALLIAERRGSRAATWATKPIASASFVAMILSDGIPGSATSRMLVVAFLLCFAGDILLLSRATHVFRAGIVTFLVAHLAFLGAFLSAGIAWDYAALALLPLALVGGLIARWILPHVEAALRRAVIAYVLVITLMVAGAAGAVAAGASPLILLAALAFWTNDILVARDRFVKKSWTNRVVGLPLYYAAMVLFAIVA